MSLKEQSNIRFIGLIKKLNRAAEICVHYPAALSVTAPYPAPCGAAAPAVPAARYCKRSFGFSRLLSLPQNGIPLRKALAAEIEPLLSEKNAGYTECQKKKWRVNELLTIKRSIGWVLHAAPSSLFPSAPLSCAVWAALAVGRMLPCRRFCALCEGCGGVLGGQCVQYAAAVFGQYGFFKEGLELFLGQRNGVQAAAFQKAPFPAFIQEYSM